MGKKIIFIGTASSGKSTLTSNVFATLKAKGFNAELVDEFIRRDIQMNGPMESIWEQYRTRAKQKELEDSVPDVDYTIIDSGTLTPYFYACLYANGNKPRERLVLQDMHKYLLDDLYLKRYDFVFYLPFKNNNSIDDGTRFQTIEQIKAIDTHMNLFFIQQNKVDNIFMVNEKYEDRLDFVIKKII
jgi:nicotinamide riboside kinase